MKFALIVLTVISFVSCSNENKDEFVFKTKDPNTFYKFKLDTNGLIKEIIPFQNSKINGTKVFFRPNTAKVGALTPYKNGKRTGHTFEIYPNYSPLFIGMVNDSTNKSEFPSYSFYNNGRIKQQWFIKSDTLLTYHFKENGDFEKLEKEKLLVTHR